MEYIRPKETPKHQRESFGRTVAQAVLKQFEDPKTAEEFKQWQKAREQKGGNKVNESKTYNLCPICDSERDTSGHCMCADKKGKTTNPLTPVLRPGTRSSDLRRVASAGWSGM